MAEYTNTPGASSHNAGLMHTLQRHRDILQVHAITSLSCISFNCRAVHFPYFEEETFVKFQYIFAL